MCYLSVALTFCLNKLNLVIWLPYWSKSILTRIMKYQGCISHRAQHSNGSDPLEEAWCFFFPTGADSSSFTYTLYHLTDVPQATKTKATTSMYCNVQQHAEVYGKDSIFITKRECFLLTENEYNTSESIFTYWLRKIWTNLLFPKRETSKVGVESKLQTMPSRCTGSPLMRLLSSWLSDSFAVKLTPELNLKKLR